MYTFMDPVLKSDMQTPHPPPKVSKTNYSKRCAMFCNVTSHIFCYICDL